LLARASERVGAQHYGAERQESGEAKAERLVREELVNLRWTEDDLAKRRKGDPGKVRIARRLRQETTMTRAWIAQRLRMGVWTHVSNLLRTEEQPVRGRQVSIVRTELSCNRLPPAWVKPSRTLAERGRHRLPRARKSKGPNYDHG
jgi:hypothetical protein